MARPLAERVLVSLGDSAPFISHIEFVPDVPRAPQPRSELVAPRPPRPESQSSVTVTARTDESDPSVVIDETMELSPMIVDVREILSGLEGMEGELDESERVEAISAVESALRVVSVAERSGLRSFRDAGTWEEAAETSEIFSLVSLRMGLRSESRISRRTGSTIRAIFRDSLGRCSVARQ